MDDLRAQLTIREVDLSTIGPFRHAILRPGEPLDRTQHDGDFGSYTRHYIAYTSETSEHAIGCASYALRRYDGQTEYDAWHFYELGIDPAFRRRGLGRILVAHGETEMRTPRHGLSNPPFIFWGDVPLAAIGFFSKMRYTVMPAMFQPPNVGSTKRMIHTI